MAIRRSVSVVRIRRSVEFYSKQDQYLGIRYFPFENDRSLSRSLAWPSLPLSGMGRNVERLGSVATAAEAASVDVVRVAVAAKSGRVKGQRTPGQFSKEKL